MAAGTGPGEKRSHAPNVVTSGRLWVRVGDKTVTCVLPGFTELSSIAMSVQAYVLHERPPARGHPP